MNSAPPPVLPSHIEETIQTIARLNADHRQEATRFERAVERVTALLARPRFIGMVTIAAAGWITLNLGAIAIGLRSVDPPPFSWLAGAISLASLYMVVLILATQRREDEVAKHREHLILELAILSEQKTTKVIRLLEEARRDNPLIRNRIDQEAEAMAQPADPQSVLDEIKKTHAAVDREKGSSDTIP